MSGTAVRTTRHSRHFVPVGSLPGAGDARFPAGTM
jgi:hypothetical protein